MSIHVARRVPAPPRRGQHSTGGLREAEHTVVHPRLPGSCGAPRDAAPSPRLADLTRTTIVLPSPRGSPQVPRVVLVGDEEQLESVTGERIAALEAVEPERTKGREAGPETGRSAGQESEGAASQGRDNAPGMERNGAAKGVDRGLGL